MPRAPKAPGHHVKQPWAGSTRRSRLPADWPSRQAACLERDGYVCQLRYDGCLTVATEADHIKPGDNHDLENLQAACSHCHRIKSAREGAAARWRHR